MSQKSLTSSELFAARIQRSEASRALLMCVVYATVATLTVVRRLAGGVVMSEEMVFYQYMGVALGALCYELFVLHALRSAQARSVLISAWRLNATAIVELGVPSTLLTILHLYSPRGQYAALSAPALLLFPITVMLSVLRLRPRTTLWLGLGAALVHWVLAGDTIRSERLDANQYPVLLGYGVLLALTGVGGMLVTRAVRRYVIEAVEEAEARERSGLRLAAMERDLEVARQIQFALLPKGEPHFGGFDIAGLNKPADQTGGDYYDWQSLPDGRLLVVMADVTGHGIGPAMVMAVCRAYARASAPLDTDPASLLARINTLLMSDLSGGRFITLAMAMLASDGRVELVSAGHGPTLLYRAAGRSVEQFGGDGLPLAVMAEESYGPAAVLAMESDDVLLMLTDGVIEWQDAAGVQFGGTRLVQALVGASSLPAARIVEEVHRAVLQHAGGTKQMDDVTIVAIKRGR